MRTFSFNFVFSKQQSKQRMKNFIFLVVLAVAISSIQSFHLKFDGAELPVSSENYVTISDGTVEGAVYDTARAFYAIPYAAPPTGLFSAFFSSYLSFIRFFSFSFKNFSK